MITTDTASRIHDQDKYMMILKDCLQPVLKNSPHYPKYSTSTRISLEVIVSVGINNTITIKLDMIFNQQQSS